MTNRFRDNNELRYSLRSIEKYAPWVRKVFLVTSGHFPYWLNTHQVTVVPHSEIFKNVSHLPVFSSPAIEANIHRIKGLSSKFIYLNDDVMFGNHISPQDFENSDGYKIFLTWDIPGCAEGCSDKYIGDGYCDTACNVAECNFDGGDCKNQKKTDQCSSSCQEKWIGDKYCDSSCNTVECGFDGGDCGLDKMKSHVVPFVDVTLPGSAPSIVFNLSEFKTIKSTWHNNPATVRSATVSQTYKILSMTFFGKKKGHVDVTVNNKTVAIKFEKGVNQTSRKLQTLIPMEDSVQSVGARKPLLDKFGSSLVHVNKLLTSAFGRAERKVPAHMPHYLDKNILKEVISKWEKEFDKTSSNRFRSDDDMQYTFTYFYYLMHHGRKMTLDDIFADLDRNHSGDLDDYEIQLLAYSLWKGKVKIGEESPNEDPMTKEYFHQVQGSLMTESKKLAITRPDLKAFKLSDIASLIPRKRVSKYKHQLAPLDQVAFHMIRDDSNHVNGQLDDIRWKLQKFVCLNDDMNSTSPNPDVVKALNNFYTWYFPTPSKYELPDGERNNVMYIEELRRNDLIMAQIFTNFLLLMVVLIWTFGVIRKGPDS